MSQVNAEWEFYCKIFSLERMARFEKAACGDKFLAFKLYDWNAQASARLWVLISHIEIALRNLINTQLESRYSENEGLTHWSLNPDNEIRLRSQRARTELDEAIRRIQNRAREVTAHRMVANLPFGFWAALVSKRYAFLWPDLASGFTGSKSRNLRGTAKLIERVRILRNHIGHHHAIIGLDLAQELATILELADAIDTSLGTWIRANSDVEVLLSSKPN